MPTHICRNAGKFMHIAKKYRKLLNKQLIFGTISNVKKIQQNRSVGVNLLFDDDVMMSEMHCPRLNMFCSPDFRVFFFYFGFFFHYFVFKACIFFSDPCKKEEEQHQRFLKTQRIIPNENKRSHLSCKGNIVAWLSSELSERMNEMANKWETF